MMRKPLAVSDIAARMSAARSREQRAELRLRLNPVERTKSPEGLAKLLERFADVLAMILDEPLHTLAGPGPEGGTTPLELRLSHFRPDLSEQAASLLEEVGR